MHNIKRLSIAISLALLTPLSGLAQEVTEAPQVTAVGSSCSHTTSTPIIPDGNIATQDELVSAQKRVKAFQEDLLDFRECLLASEEGLDPEAEDYTQTKAALSARSDQSIDLENKVAAEFNEAIRIYKTR